MERVDKGKRRKYLGKSSMRGLCDRPGCKCRILDLRAYITDDIDEAIHSMMVEVSTHLEPALLDTVAIDTPFEQETDK